MSKTDNADTTTDDLIEPGLVDRYLKDSRLERITSKPVLQQLFEDDDEPCIQDYVRVQRAFKHQYAVERDDGQRVVGAVKVDAAPMSMYEKDDLLPHINVFAMVLTSLPPRQRGMLVDVPRSVDYEDRRQQAKGHQEALEAQIENADEPDWETQIQADIAEERAVGTNFYQQTSSQREHYIVLEVSQLDAARTLSGTDGGLADLEIIGRPVKERRVDKLREKTELTGIMVDELTQRLQSLAKGIDRLHGVSARPVSSTEYTEVIADAYRPDDVNQIQNFRAMVRRSPVPGDDDSGDPIHAVDHHDGNEHAPEGISDYADEDELIRQYKTLVGPNDFLPETDGAVTIDRTNRSATLAVTGWPEVPATAFLEELYRFNPTGVDVTIATHFYRKPDGKARRDAKNQENSLEDRLDGKFGTYFENYTKEKYHEAKRFAESIEGSKFAVFDVGLFITIESSTRHRNEDTGEIYHSDDRIDDAIDDIEALLRRESGLDTKRMSSRHEDGWQTSIPIANNELGENVTLRADALARQWPYQYRNREDPQGIQMGLHDYLRQPTIVDPYDLENGHNIGFYGTIGSGKTTTMQKLIDSLLQYHHARDIPFKAIMSTPVQDFLSICEAYGGKHVPVGTHEAVNPMGVHYVNPDKYEGVQQGSPWYGFINRLDMFLHYYYDIMNLTDIGEKRDTWILAAKEAQRRQGIVQGKPETYRFPSATLPDAINVLDDMVIDPSDYVREKLSNDEETLKKRQDAARDILTHDVEPFESDGRFSHFCKRSDLNLMDHDVVYLDCKEQENDERAGGLEMMMRLGDLHEQQKEFDGRTGMFVDEFHYMLNNPRSASFFYRLHRHSRHWNLMVALATQEFGDLFEEDEKGNLTLSNSAKVIFNNQPMQYYHSTKEMNAEWADKLGLSARSEQFISNADTGEKSQGYSQALFVVDEEQYPLRIELSDDINPRQFALYQHDPTEHPPVREYLRNYRDAAGRDVCNWRWA